MTGNGSGGQARAGDPGGPLAVLQRIRESRPARPASTDRERCEMCAEEVGSEHSHLVNLEGRTLVCTCRGCWLLFTPEGAGGGKYRPVPERYLVVPDFALEPGAWDLLQIPVGVAFFFFNSTINEVAAFYPSPAGATESLLPLDAWQTIAAANPVVHSLEPDVEALLIRTGREATECYVVPIDACYELVGLLRLKWKGFDGGQEAHEELDGFFGRLRDRSREASSSGA